MNKVVPILLLLTVLFQSCGGQPETEPQIIKMARDTSGSVLDEFDLKFPNNWSVIPNYQGCAVMGFSPLTNETDDFKENVSVQVFDLNHDFESDSVANYLFKESARHVDKYQIRNQGWLNDSPEKFYFIKYNYMYKNKSVESVLYCLARKRRVYTLIYTAYPEEYEEYLGEVESLVKSFHLAKRSR